MILKGEGVNVLSKFLSNLINRKSTSSDESKFANLTKLEQAKALVEQLSQKKGKVFSPIYASQYSFQTIDFNLEQLILRLLQYTQTIEAGESITATSCYTEYHTRTLDQYLTDEDGNYIPSITLTLFAETCINLFKALETLAVKNKQSFNYTERLLTKSFVSIQHICIAINKTTQ